MYDAFEVHNYEEGDMSLVKANLEVLIALHESMGCALRKAGHGSTVEDGYFMEKLRKTAVRMGYRLIPTEKQVIVRVEVAGGVAEVTECPDWIKVDIEDHDVPVEMSTICKMDDIDNCDTCEYKRSGDVSGMINRDCPYVED